MSADASKIDPKDFSDIDPGHRLLMGPGPSDVPARVLIKAEPLGLPHPVTRSYPATAG